MSLYNMLHGVNPLAGVLLGVLNLDPSDIDRLRDVSLYNKGLEEDQYLIRILTRTGGGNREDYQNSINKLKSHKDFLREEDDDYDSTYMYFFFNVPYLVDFRKAIIRIAKMSESFVDNRSLKEK